VASYGRRDAGTVDAVGAQTLDDGARDPSWRVQTLEPPAGADVVRLDAVDASGSGHGWLAFGAPAVAQPVVLEDFLRPADAPVALAWPLAFGYPCQRQPGIVNGITEPAAYAVLWGEGALSGFADGAWQAFRGGAFAQVPRTQSVLQLATVDPVDPYIQVYVFGGELGRDRYTLTTERRPTPGASPDVG
jgi:arabinosyltransferase C